jgi:hypothetical protein
MRKRKTRSSPPKRTCASLKFLPRARKDLKRDDERENFMKKWHRSLSFVKLNFREL